MEWFSFPLELFAYIIVDLDVASIVQLEKVCKSWQENLKNQLIWKEIALRHFPSYKGATATENWRDVALTRFTVRRNMREKKCLSRMIASKEYLGSLWNVLTHSCSVSGNEALITLINEEHNYSYSTTSFIGYELVDLNTGERQLQDWLAQSNALLTKNYIITCPMGYVTHQAVYCNDDLEVVDRKSGDIFHVQIDALRNKSAIMQQNEDPNFDTICLGNDVDFFVVNLKERSWHQFTAKSNVLQFQLYGKYLAYGRVTRARGNGELRLAVIDIETGNEIFVNEGTKLLDWAISDDKIFFGNHTATGVQWMLKNFKGKTLRQYNMNYQMTNDYRQSSVRLFEHVIAYFKRRQLYFFDIHSGEFLCTLDAVGAIEYGAPPYLRAISPGKFIVSQKHGTRLIDFESRFITKSIKVSVVSPVGFDNTVPEHLRTASVPFNTLVNFASEISESRPLDLSYYTSVCVRQTKDRRESMIFINPDAKEPPPSTKFHENNTATKLFAKENKIRLYSHVNMTPTRFSEDDKLLTNASLNNTVLKPGEVIFDNVVLYQEAFMNGEWVPVDYEKDWQ
jgi:hypothetical protein